MDHVLGFDSAAHAMLALMTDPITGEPAGVHRTFLNQEAQKIERKMLGKQGVIRVSPDEAVVASLSICEGLEDALSVFLSGWRPVWAATSAGAIARFPPLAGIEALTIFADQDDAGLEAAQSCLDVWHEAGRDVAICVPGVLNV